MTRPTTPYWGKPSRPFLAQSAALGELMWGIKLAPGIRVKVSRISETGKCSYRVVGLGLLDVWRAVKGGPQMAANAAKREVDKLVKEISV